MAGATQAPWLQLSSVLRCSCSVTHLGCSQCRDEGGQGPLEEGDGGREADDVRVREQVVQERLDVVQALRAAQVEEQHADPLPGGAGQQQLVRPVSRSIPVPVLRPEAGDAAVPAAGFAGAGCREAVATDPQQTAVSSGAAGGAADNCLPTRPHTPPGHERTRQLSAYAGAHAPRCGRHNTRTHGPMHGGPWWRVRCRRHPRPRRPSAAARVATTARRLHCPATQ